MTDPDNAMKPPENMYPNKPSRQSKETHTRDSVDAIVRDALRYRAIKEKINYETASDGMVWATMEWCVEVESLSPSDLDEAIDDILLSNTTMGGPIPP